MKTKRLLLAFMLSCLLPLASWADTYQDPSTGVKYSYTVGQTTAGVDSRNNVSGAIEILSSFTVGGATYTVTSIGRSAFSGCSGLTSITIPNSVTSIGESAFSGCYGLTSITIPNSVISIGERAFYKCSCLTSISIPNSVTSIESNAFSHCRSLTSIKVESGNTKYDSRDNCNAIIETSSNTQIAGCVNTIIPNSVTSIGSSAFSGCIHMTSITIPNSVTSIGNEAFLECYGLTSITIPNSVTSIGKFAFHYCSGLTSITIPNSATSIGERAFSSCRGLTSIKVESGNTKYDSRDNCNAIIETTSNTLIAGCKNTTIPNSVTSIGSGAYENCSGLTSITIPNSVTSIGNGAFYYCSGLTSITIPNSVTSIGGTAFSYCSGLTEVRSMIEEPFSINDKVFPNYNIPLYVPKGTKEKYQTTNGWKEFTNIVEMDDAPTGNIEFADAEVKRLCVENWDTNGDGELSYDEAAAVTDLGGGFAYKENLTQFEELQYFTGLTSIGESVFEGCRGLTSITIPNSVTSIGNYAFRYCSGLTSVTIPNSVTTIGNVAFYGCSGFTSITIPNTVTSIGNNAFDGCSKLMTISIPESVTFVGEHILNNTAWYKSQSDGLIYKDNVLLQYKGNAPEGEIEIPEGTRLVAAFTFYGTGITSITIPNSMTRIGNSAFNGCPNLVSINFSNSVTNIGICAFAECSGLTSVTIPNSVTTIERMAFEGCRSLTSVTIPNSVTSIGSYVFRGCSGLTEVRSFMVDPFAIDNSVFEFYSNGWHFTSATLYVPRGTKAKYLAKEGWKNFKNIMVMIDDSPAGNIEFADADVKRICVENWDTDGDGELSYKEAAIVTDLGQVFKNNNSITSFNELQYFTGLTSIGKGAFNKCSGLTSIIIPISVTSIGYGEFYGCSGLTTITIPESVTNIGIHVFENCTSLTSIEVEEGNADFASVDGVLFKGMSTIWCYPAGKTETAYVIPSSINTIWNYAFSGCSSLTFVTIPNSVKIIGGNAFSGCSGLTSVTIPDSMTSIGADAFSGCSGLTSVTIPNSVTSIGYFAFANCSGLTEVCSEIEEPFAIDATVFPNYNIPLYVPKGTKEKYQATEGWNKFKYIVEMGDEKPAELAMIDAAQTAIEYERPYCIYTTFNGTEEGTQRYYLTTDGYLTPRPELAGIFTFYKTEGDDLFHSPGWKLDACFSNPKLSGNGGASGDLNPQGHILVDMAGRDDWEGQVWYLDENGRFAVRATNAVYDGWGSSTFWTVLDTDGDGKPEADYSWTQAFVWQLESDITVVEVTPEDGDLTARVATSPSAWNAMGVCATTFAPAVTTSDGRSAQMVETYETTVAKTGEMMYQTVSGLEEGYYAVELYANAQYTDGRGFGSDLKDGATDVVYVSANDRRSYVTAHVGTAVAENGVYTVCTPVSDGTLHISLVAEKPGTNWHTIQIKSLRKVDGIITANDLTMTYGDEVPRLTYFTEGVEVEGQPVLSCAATKASPAGTYPITISQGTVTNGNMGYAAGILTITKAPLKISAGTYTKKQGEENPEFTLAYEGFVNDETEAVLTKEPTVTCEATKESTSGEYAVNVAGAEAENYEISYIPGVLTVTAADDEVIAGDITGTGVVEDEDVDAFIELYLDDEIPEPGDADFSRFDANGDGIISLADAVAIFYLSNGLNFDGTDPNAARAATPMDNGQWIMDNDYDLTVEATELGNGIVRYTLTSDFEYAGFAIDVKGAQVVSESAEGMTLRSADTKGKHRIVAYNFGQAAAAGTVLTLDVLGEAQFSNINFSDANARNIRFRLSETTGIGAKPMDNGQWIMDHYYDLQGRAMESMKKGVNILRNGNGKAKKVSVK